MSRHFDGDAAVWAARALAAIGLRPRRAAAQKPVATVEARAIASLARMARLAGGVDLAAAAFMRPGGLEIAGAAGAEAADIAANAAFLSTLAAAPEWIHASDLRLDPRFAADDARVADRPLVELHAAPIQGAAPGVVFLASFEKKPAAGGATTAVLADFARMAADLDDYAATACRDPASGALAQRRFLEDLEKELARCRRYRGALAVLALNVDRLGDMRAKLGHVAYNAITRQAADRLHATLRASDLVGRAEAYDFLIAMPETALDRAALGAERLLAAFRASPFSAGGARYRFTASIGVAAFSPTLDAASDVITRAAAALEEAELAGADRVALRGAVVG